MPKLVHSDRQMYASKSDNILYKAANPYVKYVLPTFTLLTPFLFFSGQLKIHIDRVLVRVKIRQDLMRDSGPTVVGKRPM